MKITIMKLFVLALGSCLKLQDILHITSISYVFIAIKYSYRLHFMNAQLVITDSITTLLYVLCSILILLFIFIIMCDFVCLDCGVQRNCGSL